MISWFRKRGKVIESIWIFRMYIEFYFLLVLFFLNSKLIGGTESHVRHKCISNIDFVVNTYCKKGCFKRCDVLETHYLSFKDVFVVRHHAIYRIYRQFLEWPPKKVKNIWYINQSDKNNLIWISERQTFSQ